MTGKVVSAALLALLLTGTTREQTPPEPRDQAAPQPAAAHELATIPLSAGTAINASLVSPLDSEHNKPGDLVSALVTESVVYQRSVMLPKGSRIVGHVVRTGADVEQGSAIFVEFDKAVLPNGQEALLNAGIQALAPPNTPATIPSRKDYERDWVTGILPAAEVSKTADTVVLPSTYTAPRKSVASELPVPKVEGGLDPQGRFTPDSKGAFAEPNLSIFTPVSEGSHGTVLVGAQKSVRLSSGTHLLIVIQPPASSPDGR